MRASKRWLLAGVGLACTSGLFVAPHAAPAQGNVPPYIWDAGGANDNWNNTDNWNQAGYPDDTGDEAVFPDNNNNGWTTVKNVDEQIARLQLYEPVNFTGSEDLTTSVLRLDASTVGNNVVLTLSAGTLTANP